MPFDQRSYNRDYYRENREKLISDSRKYYHDRRGDPSFDSKIKASREDIHFGIPRSVIFRKTKGKCFFCGKKAQVVHHLDEDGRTYESVGLEPGKDPRRLVPACRACHIDIHRHKLAIIKKTRANGFWARNYDHCVECGRNDRKHSGHGLCTTCAARTRARRRKEGGV